VGLITGLLTLPLAPVRGVAWVSEILAEEALRQQAELQSPQRALADHQAARAAGELSEEEFAELEAGLIEAILTEGH
jgi:hypothetical protein